MTNSEIADELDEINNKISVLRNILSVQYEEREFYSSQIFHEETINKLEIIKRVLDL